MQNSIVSKLQHMLNDQVQENAPLAQHTSARIGGPADLLVTVRNADELKFVVNACWDASLDLTLLGSGSNILVSDKGIRGVVILNKAKDTDFHLEPAPYLTAASGEIFSNLAHRCAGKGFSGLEWAATVPGTVGGAVYGNAGAFGSDTAANLIRAEIMTKNGTQWMTSEQLMYGYRTSILKHSSIPSVILTAEFSLKQDSVDSIKKKIAEYTERRKNTQPAGASMGSMFKNPAGSHAGKLIEDAGLKGYRIGNAEISTIHANFIINHGETSAGDIRMLIRHIQKTVQDKFGIDLELEVELIGEWE